MSNGIPRFWSEAHNLFFGDQALRADDSKLEESSGGPHIVERPTQFGILFVDQFVNGRITLMGGALRIARGLLDLLENALAEAFQRERVKLSKELPV